jgi:hypothetical protein
MQQSYGEADDINYSAWARLSMTSCCQRDFMKVYVRGGSFDVYGRDAVYLPILHQIAPENSTLDKQGRVVMHRLYLPEGDPRVKLVDDALIDHSKVVPENYVVTLPRWRRVTHFTEEDYATARYFWIDTPMLGRSMHVPENFLSLPWFSDDVPRIAISSLRMLSTRKAYAASGSGSEILVPGGIKRELEAMHFVGLGFKFIQPIKKRTPSRPSPGYDVPKPEYQAWLDSHIIVNAEYASEDESWWILHPTIELPKQHPSVIRQAWGGEPRPQHVQGPAWFHNEGMFDFHPVYTKVALASVGPFDIARSWEQNSIEPSIHLNICSRRFMEAFKKYAKHAVWLPVEERDE